MHTTKPDTIGQGINLDTLRIMQMIIAKGYNINNKGLE